MPEKELIQKANVIGGTISVWMKVTGVVVSIIGYGFLTYYQIQSNSAKIHEWELTVQKELQIWATRSDKRYKRAMQRGDKLEVENAALEQELEEFKERVIEDIAFMKGRQYEQDKNR